MDKKRYFHTFAGVFKKAYKASPFSFTIMYVLFFVSGLFFSLSVKVRADFFNSVFESGELEGVGRLILGLLFVIGIEVMASSTDLMGNYYGEIFDVKMKYLMQKIVNEKATKIKAANYEDPIFLDTLSKANEGAKSSMVFLNMVMDMVFMYLPKILFVTLYLAILDVRLVLIVIIIFLPVLWTKRTTIGLHKATEEALTSARRYLEHYEEALYSKSSYKETLILGVQDKFKKLATKYNHLIYSKEKKAAIKAFKSESRARMVKVVGYCLVLLYLTYFLIQGHIEVGAYIAIFFAVERLSVTLENALIHRMKDFSKHYAKIENYIKFMALEEDDHNGNHGKEGAIVFDKVGFSYPGANRDVLRDITFEIQQGETIAIVGANGSGKSTLSKLINGVYEPSKGTITWNGKSRKQTNPEGVSQLFQDFNKYPMTIEDNYRLGSIEKEISSEAVNDKLLDFGFDAHKFPDSEKTLLSKEFGGIDLSGGEWQRLAMGRAFHKDSNIGILDEPTAAIDPINEDQLYRHFLKMLDNKTGIIITHRLATCKYVDKVMLLDKGRILAYGNHNELVTSHRLYQEMWYKQSDVYV